MWTRAHLEEHAGWIRDICLTVIKDGIEESKDA